MSLNRLVRYPVMLLLMYGLVGATCAQNTRPAAQQAPQRITTRLDYQIDPETDGPVVLARLNNQLDVHMLLDTGSNIGFLSESAAAKLGLTPMPLLTASGKPFTFNGKPARFISVNIRLGEYVLNGPTVVLPLKEIRGNKSNIDGMLGLNGMSLASVFFDFPHKQVTFFSPHDLTPEQLLQLGMNDASPISNVSKQELLFSVPLTLNGTVHTEAVVDTGAAETELPGDVLEPLKITPLRRSIPYSNMYGNMTENLLKVNTLTVGTLLFSNQLLYTWDHAPGETQSHIGMDVLSHCRLLIDYTAKTLYLKPITQDNVIAPPQAAVTSPLSIVMPMEHLKDALAPCVRLTLQDGKSYLFIIELGIPACLLDQRVAEQTQLPIQPEKDEQGKEVKALRTTILPAAALGTATHTDFPAVQIPFVLHDFSDLHATYPDVAGNLGTNVFAQTIWKLDFGKRQITFSLPGDSKTSPQEPQKAKRLPLKLEQGLLFVEGSVDDKPTRFVLSSSNEILLRSPDTIASLHPVARLQHTETSSGTPAVDSRVRLHTIKVGENIWKQPSVTQSPADAKDTPNVLGMDFLSRFRVTLDLPAQSWYLEPDPAYKEQSDSVVGLGFTPHINADKNLEIVSLSLPSPASEAGLKVGDVITEVNGLPVKSTPVQQISAQVQHKPEGTVIRLVVQSKGEDKSREVTLKIRKLL